MYHILLYTGNWGLSKFYYSKGGGGGYHFLQLTFRVNLLQKWMTGKSIKASRMTLKKSNMDLKMKNVYS